MVHDLATMARLNREAVENHKPHNGKRHGNGRSGGLPDKGAYKNQRASQVEFLADTGDLTGLEAVAEENFSEAKQATITAKPASYRDGGEAISVLIVRPTDSYRENSYAK